MKNSLIKITALSVAALGLSACDIQFSGTLTMEKPITFLNGLDKRELRALDKCKEKEAAGEKETRRCKKLKEKQEKYKKVIEVGSYHARVVPGRRNIKIKLYDPEKRSKVLQEFELKVPRKVELPKTSGEISLSAAQVGVNMDVKGTIDTQYSTSDTTRTTETCTYEVPVQECGWVDREDEEGNTHSVYDCWTEYETHYGTHEVEYYYSYTDKDLNLQLFRGNTNVLLSTYHGTWHNSDKIYTYQGECY